MADGALCDMYPKTIGKDWRLYGDEQSDVGRILFASSIYGVYHPILNALSKSRIVAQRELRGLCVPEGPEQGEWQAGTPDVCRSLF